GFATSSSQLRAAFAAGGSWGAWGAGASASGQARARATTAGKSAAGWVIDMGAARHATRSSPCASRTARVRDPHAGPDAKPRKSPASQLWLQGTYPPPAMRIATSLLCLCAGLAAQRAFTVADGPSAAALTVRSFPETFPLGPGRVVLQNAELLPL